MKADRFALPDFLPFVSALFTAAFFFSCQAEKEVPYTLIPREGLVSSARTAEIIDGVEIIRYSFETEEGPEELSITPEGYYRASRRGAGCLRVKTKKRTYSLEQFAETFFRPDLAAEGGTAGKRRETLAGLLAAKEPPRIRAALGAAARDGEPGLALEVTDESGGGIGTLALFYRDLRGEEFPAAFMDGNSFVRGKRRKGWKTVYDLFLPIPRTPKFEPSGLAGVSVFNGDNSAGSERLWMEIPGFRDIPKVSEKPAPGKPVLHVFAASAFSSSAVAEDSFAVEELFARQESGALYGAVRVRSLRGRDLGRESFFRAFNDLAAQAGREDVVVIILSGPGAADGAGDLRFFLSGANGEEAADFLDKRELAAAFSLLDTQKVLVLLDIRGSQKKIEMETAFYRLKSWLGPGVFLAGSPAQGEEAAFMRVLLEAAGGAWMGSRRCLGAAEFSGFVQKNLPAAAAFLPEEDFPLIDRCYASGELRMQTMFSGAVLIEGFDIEGRPLTFGETQTRLLPPGTYSVTMTYRNGRRETKRAEIVSGRGEWVVFTYTPELLAGDFKGRLPAFGVSVAELNPANYKKTGAAILEKMDLPPYYAAFLSGEQLYRSGDYNKAIEEYTRSISLKGDYAGAFISRGNAWRRTGQTGRAIADYSRALTFDKDYAEVYNYRGFLYALEGNHAKAIEDYTRALKLKSGYVDAWFNRAYGYIEMKDWDRAIADYTQVIKLEPSNAAAYKERAYAWSNKGDSAKAAADYAAAERLGG